MKPDVLKVLATALFIISAHYFVLLTVRSPIAADYWLRECVIVKKYQAASMASPKLIFSGGSSSLFGIDAAEVQKQLNIPAINLGLSASLRLEYHLALDRAVAKPGDIIILSLEPEYYDTYTATWTTWNLRNALAWDTESLMRLPPAAPSPNLFPIFRCKPVLGFGHDRDYRANSPGIRPTAPRNAGP